MINLSSKVLTNDQIDILKKGLKFTPTPKTNDEDLERDIKDFNRRLRLAEHFYKETPDTTDCDIKPLVRNKSDWNPQPGKDKC